MPPTPPSEAVPYDAWFDAYLLQHHVDIQRLWKRYPQFPQQFIGAYPHEIDVFGTSTSTSSSSTSSSSTSSSTSTTLTTTTTTATLDTTDECGECSGGMAECWEFSIAGITDLACSGNCSNLNGTFLLTHVSNCRFDSDLFTSCAGTPNGARWTLNYHSSNDQWRLVPDFGDVKSYRLAAASFDCLGPNVMNVFGGSTDCDDWPSSVTIEPASCL